MNRLAALWPQRSKPEASRFRVTPFSSRAHPKGGAEPQSGVENGVLVWFEWRRKQNHLLPIS